MQPSSYARLPPHFYARLGPTPVARPRLIQFNRPLSAELGLALDGLDDDSLAAIFSGNQLPTGIEPIATAYAGTSSATSCRNWGTGGPFSSASA